MKVILVEPHKEPIATEIDNDIESIREVVGGTPELARVFLHDVAIVCNESGKRLGLPKNRTLVDRNGCFFDYIAGTFFMCCIRDDYYSIPDDLIETYMYRVSEDFVFTDSVAKEGFNIYDDDERKDFYEKMKALAQFGNLKASPDKLAKMRGEAHRLSYVLWQLSEDPEMAKKLSENLRLEDTEGDVVEEYDADRLKREAFSLISYIHQLEWYGNESDD